MPHSGHQPDLRISAGALIISYLAIDSAVSRDFALDSLHCAEWGRKRLLP